MAQIGDIYVTRFSVVILMLSSFFFKTSCNFFIENVLVFVSETISNQSIKTRNENKKYEKDYSDTNQKARKDFWIKKSSSILFYSFQVVNPIVLFQYFSPSFQSFFFLFFSRVLRFFSAFPSFLSARKGEEDVILHYAPRRNIRNSFKRKFFIIFYTLILTFPFLMFVFFFI